MQMNRAGLDKALQDLIDIVSLQHPFLCRFSFAISNLSCFAGLGLRKCSK